MTLRDIFRRIGVYPKKPLSQNASFAVIDASDNTLVAIGTYSPVILFLNESLMDTIFVPDIPYSALVRLIRMSPPSEYPEWSWDNTSRTFRKTSASIVTEDIRNRAVLLAKKSDAITRVISRINRLRSKVNTGLIFQSTIYLQKESQAQKLKDANFDEKDAGDILYVSQYADDSGITLRQAAEEILLQAQLDRDYLARTEKMRLGLFKGIRLAKTSEEVEAALSAMR